MRIIVLALALIVAPLTTAAADRADQAVLVTGASSGIGRNIAETLAAEGYTVFAGARKQRDLDALNAIDNVRALRLDVTVQSEIDAAVAAVRDSGKTLAGLVNNAGIAALGPMIEQPEEDLVFTFDVNVLGPYRVTKAFADLLIESKGRVTTIGSISGILSGPFMGSYSMSKHAVEAYTDSLATELEPFGVRVSVIEPGNYRSEITKTMKDRLIDQGIDSENSRYRDRWEGLLGADLSRQQFKQPDEVTAAVRNALFGEYPKRRYMVVPNEQEAQMTIRQAIIELVQLNTGQPYEFTREELIAMLDEAMAPERIE